MILGIMSQYKPIYKKLKENSERFRASEAEILRNGKAGIQRKPSKTAPLKGVQKKLNKKLKKLKKMLAFSERVIYNKYRCWRYSLENIKNNLTYSICAFSSVGRAPDS